MALIVQAGDLVLRREAIAVPKEKLGTQELRSLVAEMVATMRAAPGVGLAAPQIGVPWQLLVAEDDSENLAELSEAGLDKRDRNRLPLVAIVNPELTTIGDEKAVFFEGCLSISGWSALVPRALAVEVSGLTPEGEPLKLELRGWPARILQHEVDHLHGTLYVDRMFSRSFSRTDAAQRQWGDRPPREIATALGIAVELDPARPADAGQG
jgi:peptide deformylase